MRVIVLCSRDGFFVCSLPFLALQLFGVTLHLLEALALHLAFNSISLECTRDGDLEKICF